MGGWVSRESFSGSDPEVTKIIESVAPSANKAAYQSIVTAFYNDVIKGSPETPTPQAVDAYLGYQTKTPITATDKQMLRKILIQVFKIQDGPSAEREAKQIKFQPDGTSLQPKMGALLPISSNAPPGDYVTADPDPVLPDSKKMAQKPTLNRGGSGEAAAYTWNMAAYQQDDVTGSYPSRGIPPATIPPKNVRESMSTMAGTTTITNEIYGPRVPKERGKPPAPLRDADGNSLDSTQIYPSIYGPSMRLSVAPKTGTGDLTGQDTIPATAFIIPSLPKTEPVPFLTDFSKFGK